MMGTRLPSSLTRCSPELSGFGQSPSLSPSLKPPRRYRGQFQDVRLVLHARWHSDSRRTGIDPEEEGPHRQWRDEFASSIRHPLVATVACENEETCVQSSAAWAPFRFERASMRLV